MRMYLECVPCLARQALRAAEFCGADTATKERVLRKTLRLLGEMRWDRSPMEMGQGNYETFSGEQGIYFLLVVKCPVMAGDLTSCTGAPTQLGDAILWRS